MWILALVLSGASAQEGPVDVPYGRVALELSPDAELVTFPRTRRTRIELGVYDNRVPIEVEPFSTKHLSHVDVLRSSESTWFLTLHVDRPEVDIRLEPTDDGVVLQLHRVTEAPVVDPDDEVASLEDLLEGELARRMVPPDLAALTPLWGDAHLVAMHPDSYPLPLTLPPALNDGDLTASSWSDVRRDRALLEDARRRTPAKVRLAYAHLALGLPREALYYFEAVVDEVPPKPELQVARARAAMQVTRWEDARTFCARAHQGGGHPATVLECLGLVSAATADPPPTQTARALLQEADRPEARFLAAQLLQKDGRHDEALPVLAELQLDLHGEVGSRAAMALGDALLAVGELDDAQDAYTTARATGELEQLIELRMMMLDLLKAGPRSWRAPDPVLTSLADDDGPLALEARYLLAQLGARHAQWEEVADHLTYMVDRYPDLAQRADVYERLFVACSRSMEDLADDSHKVELLAFFQYCWRSELDGHLHQGGPLALARDAYEDLGLVDKALSLQIRQHAVELREERDDLATLENLARLYARAGRPHEALHTLEQLRDTDTYTPHRAALVQGEAHRGLGELDQAKAAWQRSGEHAETRLEAGLRLASTPDGCAHALPLLTHDQAPVPERPLVHTRAHLQPDVIQLRIGRCHYRVGAHTDALDLALSLLEQEDLDEEVAKLANELANAAAWRSGLTRSPARTEERQWGRLFDEQRRHRALVQAISDWEALGTRND